MVHQGINSCAGGDFGTLSRTVNRLAVILQGSSEGDILSRMQVYSNGGAQDYPIYLPCSGDVLILSCLFSFPFAEFVPPYLSRMCLGKGINKLNLARVFVGGGHSFDMLLQAGH